MQKSISISIVDNFDSFTFNLFHYVKSFTNDVQVIRIDEVKLEMLNRFDAIIISPGPGLPQDNKILFEIIEKFKDIKPILGICLGHQAIACAFGGELYNMQNIMHGVSRKTKVIKQDIIYKNIPSQFNSGRYHSWAVKKESLPECISITAIDENEVIMSITHNKYNVKGIQYHPESILTPDGKQILFNWFQSI